MPNPQQPKVYGSPIGYQPPDPNRQQRAATPATDAQVAQAYQQHMKQAIIAAHNQFKQKALQARVRGSSSTPRAPRKPPAIVDAEIDRQSR